MKILAYFLWTSALVSTTLLAQDVARVAPKVMIVSMWTPEAEIWYRRFSELGMGELSLRITLPGLSMLYPDVACTQDGFVCQLTIGEGEINAAASMMALALSPALDLTRTYFLIAGIAGVNPRHATLGSVALSRYAIQVGLQYEIDPRSLPADYPTGYIPYGRQRPYEYPLITYGTEVFEVNANLRDAAYEFALRASLVDDEALESYRAQYEPAGDSYRKGLLPPTVELCDTLTSDVYFSGSILSEVFENTTTIWTNGTGVYCMTAQEDNATLEVLVRAAMSNLVDFGRIVILRSGSNFDRPPPDMSDIDHLTRTNQNGFATSLENIFNVGGEIVRGIIHEWNCTFENGIPADNYIGDIFGSLGGTPDFGLGPVTLPGAGASSSSRRDRRPREVTAGEC
ncbi:purine nucleoside permease [Stachybotrys elegans]|uniref:Purine nucleoside permease n=1 Tax=Stachybotrys elegans TaxID=80388 RepID=A0A8K0T2E7_9HYPO|nr:purine nucleoside permease [Stachybotrys elegans]